MIWKIARQSMRLMSTKYKFITMEIDKTNLCIMKLNNPPANLNSFPLNTEITNLFQKLEVQDVNGIILTSNLPGVFSGGLDVNILRQNSKNVEEVFASIQNAILAIYSSPVPTVAVINGHCVTSGTGLALCCNYRIMTKGYKIGLPEVAVGITQPSWLNNLVVMAAGHQNAEIVCTTGHLYDTEDAHRMGLVNEIFDNGDHGLEKARAFINKFNKLSTPAVKATRYYFRKKFIDDFKRNFNKYTGEFVKNVTAADTQKCLTQYYNNLKNKTK